MSAIEKWNRTNSAAEGAGQMHLSPMRARWSFASIFEMLTLPLRTVYYLVTYTAIFTVLIATLVLIPKNEQ